MPVNTHKLDLFNVMHWKTVEPEPRMYAGRFQYVIHRFPIKGGISRAQLLAKTAAKPNTLFQLTTTARS